MGWLSSLFDALLPPPADVRAARALSEAELFALSAPRTCGEAIALFPYRDPRIRALIRAVKYHGETRALAAVGRIAGEYLVEVIAEKEAVAGWERPLIVPVPPSPRRLRERGYGQAERIARATLPYLGGARLAPDLLAREERASQVSVPRVRRTENIAEAFFVREEANVSGACIVLMDDVIESGATMADATRALLEAGAKDVAALALAH
jgi:predicted amidophosphoribosyltransferase